MPNLQKIFWVALAITIIFWVGVGIYYLRPSSFSPASVSPSPEDNKLKFVTPSPKLTKEPVYESLEGTHFIVGNFQGWEEIEGSPDRYIFLVDLETNQSFPKIRVGFEFSTLFGYKEGKDATVFAITKTGEDYAVLGYFQDFTSEEIDKLIKKGDFVKIILKKNVVEETDDGYQDLSVKNSKDENGNLLAHWLLIKREEGKTLVEQELGREIKTP